MNDGVKEKVSGIRRGRVPAEAILSPDERLIRITRISAGIYWKGIAVLILAVILLINPILSNLGIFFVIVALIMLGLAYLTKHYLLLALTDRRVMIRHGILNLDTIQLRLSRIESVELEWTVPGRIFGYATVVLTGTGSRVTAVPFIADGAEFRNELDALLNAREDRI